MSGKSNQHNAFLLWGIKQVHLCGILETISAVEESPLQKVYEYFLCAEDSAGEREAGRLWNRPLKNLSLNCRLSERWQQEVLFPDIPWKEGETALRLAADTTKQLEQILDQHQKIVVLADTQDVALLLALLTWLRRVTNRKNQTMQIWLYYGTSRGDKDTPASVNEMTRYVLLKRFEQLSAVNTYEGSLAVYLLTPQFFVFSAREEVAFCLTTIQSALWLETHIRFQRAPLFSAAACALLLRQDEQRRRHITRLLVASFYDCFSADLDATAADWGWSRLDWNMRPPQFPSLEALEDYLRQNVHRGTGYNQTVETFIQTGFKVFASFQETVTAKAFALFVEEQGASFFDAFQRQFSAQWEPFLTYKVQELRLRAGLAPEKTKTVFTRFITLLENLIVLVRQISAIENSEQRPPVSELLVRLILKHNGQNERPLDFWKKFLKQTITDSQKTEHVIDEVETKAREFSRIPFEKMIQFQALNDLAATFSVGEKAVFKLASGKKLTGDEAEKLSVYYSAILNQVLYRELRLLERGANVKDSVLQTKSQQAWYSSQLTLQLPGDLFSDYGTLDVPLKNQLFLLYNQISGLRLEDFVVGEKLLARTVLALRALPDKERFSLALLPLIPEARQMFLEKLRQVVGETARKIERYQWQWHEGRIIKKNQTQPFLNLLEDEMRRLSRTKTSPPSWSLTEKERVLAGNIWSFLQRQKEIPELAGFLDRCQVEKYFAAPLLSANSPKARVHV